METYGTLAQHEHLDFEPIAGLCTYIQAAGFDRHYCGTLCQPQAAT